MATEEAHAYWLRRMQDARSCTAAGAVKITHLSSDRFAVVNLKQSTFVCHKKSVCKYQTNIFLLRHLRTTKIFVRLKNIFVSVLPRPGAPLSSRRSFLQGGEGQAEGLVRERNLFAPLFFFFFFFFGLPTVADLITSRTAAVG